MIFVAHRGNTRGKVAELENTVDYVESALNDGFNVEVDVWCVKNKLLLGHDEPRNYVSDALLLNARVWCHAKNIEALRMLLEMHAHCFWHENDAYTLTSSGYIWTYPGNVTNDRCVIVLTEPNDDASSVPQQCAGVCSDNVSVIKCTLQRRFDMFVL